MYCWSLAWRILSITLLACEMSAINQIIYWLIWKDPDGRKDWRQEEKGMAEDEMVGWHHQRYGPEFE